MLLNIDKYPKKTPLQQNHMQSDLICRTGPRWSGLYINWPSYWFWFLLMLEQPSMTAMSWIRSSRCVFQRIKVIYRFKIPNIFWKFNLYNSNVKLVVLIYPLFLDSFNFNNRISFTAKIKLSQSFFFRSIIKYTILSYSFFFFNFLW